MKFSEIINRIFFPSDIKCIVCDGELSFNTKYGVCDRCNNLEYNTKYCKTCGRHVGDMTTYCVECSNKAHEFDIARAPFMYKDKVTKLIYRLKYGHGAYLSKYMAQFMYDTFIDSQIDVDFICYVPMSKERQNERGYNQAEEIAKALSTISQIPLIPVLKRIKNTKNLARMGKEERLKAIADSFEICKKDEVKAKRVLLVDDVFTSGATTNECAKVLKKAKADFVYVLTFATSTDKIQMY